jgi:hypothetical protein
MESTPVSGVEIIKDNAAPFVAPLFFRDRAVGTTPHEHSGSGNPIREALITDFPFLLIPPDRKVFSHQGPAHEVCQQSKIPGRDKETSPGKVTTIQIKLHK